MRKSAAIILVVFSLTGIFDSLVHADTDTDFAEAMRLADEAAFYKKFEQAEAYFKFAAEQKPKEAEPHVGLGQLFYQMSRYGQAKEEFQKAQGLKKGPPTKEFLNAALQEMKVYEGFFKEIEQARDPQKLFELHLKVGESMMKSGRFYMALAGPHLEWVLETQPDNAELLGLLAEGYFNSSNPRKAAFYYKKLVLLRPRSALLNEKLAESSISLGDYELAGKSYKRALRETIREGNDKAKSGELKKLIQSLPKSRDQVGALIEDGESDRALSILRQTLALNPSDVSTITQMGRVYEEMGQDAQAERLYKEALRLRPEYAGAHYYWARFLLLKKKQYEDAIDEFRYFQDCVRERVFPLEDPKMMEDEKKELIETSRYIASIYSEIMKQPAQAIKELESLKPDEIKNADVYYDLGVWYSRAKKRISAFACFKKVIALDPQSEQAKAAENAIDFIHKHSDDGGQYTGPYD